MENKGSEHCHACGTSLSVSLLVMYCLHLSWTVSHLLTLSALISLPYKGGRGC